jgi:hypothetical protein
MSRRFSPRSSLLLLLCLPACNDDGPSDGETTFVTGDGDSETLGDGDGDPTGDGDGDPTGDGDGDPTGDGDGDGDPCAGGPGCYPSAVVDGAGLSSRSPLGCGSQAAFSSPWFVDIAGGGAIDAAKSTPIATDFDGNGVTDIFLTARKTGAPSVFPGNGGGSFGAPTFLSGIQLFAGGWGGDAGDIDGGGGTDIAIGDHTSGALAWLHAGGFSFTVTTSGLPQGELYSGAGLGDFDGDGDLDVVFGSDQFGGGYHAALFSGGSWTQVTPAGLPPLGTPGNSNVGSVLFEDYDGDGDMDMFAIGQPQTGGVAAFVYENGGDGSSWTSRGQFTGGSIQSLGNPVQGAIGDVNCDGNVDISAGGSVHLGDGAGNWTPSAVVDPADLSQLGDMNGDGFLDIVTHSNAGLRLYLGDGTGAFAHDPNTGLPDGTYVPPGFVAQGTFEFTDAYGMDLADFDGNGVLDIVRAYKIRDSAVFGDGANENILEVWVR